MKLWRACLAPALAALAAGLAGCESFYASEAARTHPAPGRLVDVDHGRRIQIDCRGPKADDATTPTVVFQSGGDVMGSLAWTPVHDRIAKTTRACAYSRAGLMWSDPDSDVFKPEDVANDLHAALKGAGETAPFVLVSHSRGGLYSLIFAGLYPDDVAGLVFADSSHPEQEQRYRAAGLAQPAYVSASQEVALAFGWTGLMRLSPPQVDPSIAPEVQAFWPKSAAGNAREARARDETQATADLYRDLRNWPVVVLARELPEQTRARLDDDARDGYQLLDGPAAPPLVDAPKSERIWRELQLEIASWSSRGRLEVVPNSNHAFFFTRPDVVVKAVNEVIAAARVLRRSPAQPQLSPLLSPQLPD